jgi:hypothetical protein
MGKLPNTLKLSQHLTPKQKKFAEVMVAKWGQITKAEAVREAGYEPKRDNGASELGSKLTNPNKNPHVVRYIEKLRAVIDPSRKVLLKSIRVPLYVFQGSRTTNHPLSFSVLINLNGSSWISYSFPPPGSSR